MPKKKAHNLDDLVWVKQGKTDWTAWRVNDKSPEERLGQRYVWVQWCTSDRQELVLEKDIRGDSSVTGRRRRHRTPQHAQAVEDIRVKHEIGAQVVEPMAASSDSDEEVIASGEEIATEDESTEDEIETNTDEVAYVISAPLNSKKPPPRKHMTPLEGQVNEDARIHKEVGANHTNASSPWSSLKRGRPASKTETAPAKKASLRQSYGEEGKREDRELVAPVAKLQDAGTTESFYSAVEELQEDWRPSKSEIATRTKDVYESIEDITQTTFGDVSNSILDSLGMERRDKAARKIIRETIEELMEK